MDMGTIDHLDDLNDNRDHQEQPWSLLQESMDARPRFHEIGSLTVLVDAHWLFAEELESRFSAIKDKVNRISGGML